MRFLNSCILLALIILVPLVSGSAYTFLTRGQADALYCQLGACAGGAGAGGGYQGQFPWLYNDTTTMYFNASQLSTIYYNATQSANVAGTVDGGVLADTHHSDGHYDGRTFNFSEIVGPPGLDMRMNFTNVSSFNQGIMRYYTSSLSGDLPVIQVYDYDSGTWEDYPYLTETEDFRTISEPVFDSSDHVQDGIVQMRLYKASKGNINNHYYVDWLSVSSGFGTPSGEEGDPVFSNWLVHPYLDNPVNVSAELNVTGELNVKAGNTFYIWNETDDGYSYFSCQGDECVWSSSYDFVIGSNNDVDIAPVYSLNLNPTFGYVEVFSRFDLNGNFMQGVDWLRSLDFNQSVQNLSVGNDSLEIRQAVNGTRINGTGFDSVNAQRWKGTSMDGGACITPGTVARCDGGGVASWTAQVLATWSEVLGNGAQTSGEDPILTYGDIFKFGTGSGALKWNASITGHATGKLNLSADEGIFLSGDVRIKEGGNYQVPAGGTAFSADGFDARLDFDGGADGGFEFYSTQNAISVKIGGVNANEGEIFTHAEGRMALGDNGLDASVVDGGLNLTTLYYDNVVPKSPHYLAEDPESGYTRICVIDRDGTTGMLYFDKGSMKFVHNSSTCSQKTVKLSEHSDNWGAYQADKAECLNTGKENTYFYTNFEAYRQGVRDCNLSLEWAEWHCKQDYGANYYYDVKYGICRLDPVLDCEALFWRYYNGTDCLTNPFWECVYNQPKNENRTFNYTNMKCDPDPEKECINRGYGWIWDKGACTYDPNKNNNDLKAECEARGPEWLWTGTDCVSLNGWSN